MTERGRVLIVDNEEKIRRLLCLALAGEGFEVLAVPHGQAALELSAEWQPQVILLDMRMPVMDGWQFARAYRESPGPHARIVVVTAALDASKAAEQIEADAYLAKPFRLEILISLLEAEMQRV